MAKKNTGKKATPVTYKNPAEALNRMADCLTDVMEGNKYPDAVYVRLEKMVADFGKLADRTETITARQAKKDELQKAAGQRQAERKSKLQDRIAKMQAQLAKISK